jgi:hypothetical protein
MVMEFNDIFPLENSKELTCSIESYAIGHSALRIRVMNQGKFVCYLYLTSVLYISAPMYWRGADFRIASSEECEQLLMKIGYPQKLLELESIDYYKLYQVENSDVSTSIQILAWGISKIDYDVLALRKRAN